MSKIDFKELTSDELIEKYVGFKSELFGLRFQLSVGQLSDTNKIEQAKRNIARSLTEMSKRGIDSNKIKMPAVRKAKKESAKKQKSKKETKPADKKTAKPQEKTEKNEVKVEKAEPKKTAPKAKKGE